MNTYIIIIQMKMEHWNDNNVVFLPIPLHNFC